VVPQAWTGREALSQTAAALWPVVALGAGASAAWTAIVGLVVIVVSQAEKPDEPQD
jgi:hypothetical protein